MKNYWNISGSCGQDARTASTLWLTRYGVRVMIHIIRCTSYNYRVAGSLVEMFLLCAYCAPTPEINAFLARYKLMLDRHWHDINPNTFLDWIAKATKNTKEGTLYGFMLTLYDTEPELRHENRTRYIWGTKMITHIIARVLKVKLTIAASKQLSWAGQKAVIS